MKLRNKKTGEIITPNDFTFATYDDGIKYGHHIYNSLAELNEEWEDYEEPKEYWYIGYKNIVRNAERVFHSDYADNDITEKRREIGNCFETREEAENALEKLKAWKRLRDKNFKFYGWNKGSLLENMPNNITFACDDTRIWAWEDIQADLDLLFSGEDD